MVFREAKPADREKILEIASATWEGWDYVPLYLDNWIEEGGLYVAQEKGEILGITKTTELSPGELWFEAIRVAEEYRGKGLGRKIAERQLELALKESPRSIRLSTANVNKASLKVVRNLGFTEYVTFDYFFNQGPLATPGKEIQEKEFKVDASQIDPLWDLVRASEEYRKSKGLLAHTWKFSEWDKGVFASLAGQGRIYAPPDSSGVLIILPNRYRPQSREVAFIESDGESLKLLANLARAELSSIPQDERVFGFAASPQKGRILAEVGMGSHPRIQKVYVFDYPLG